MVPADTIAAKAVLSTFTAGYQLITNLAYHADSRPASVFSSRFAGTT
jgi:hypothetical protein